MSISRDTQDEYTVRSYDTAAAAYQVVKHKDVFFL